MSILCQNISDHKKGDYFNGAEFDITVNGGYPTITKVELWVQKGTEDPERKFSTDPGGGLSLIAGNTKFQIDGQVIDLQEALYKYDAKYYLSSGGPKTYVQGTWKIFKGTTQ